MQAPPTEAKSSRRLYFDEAYRRCQDPTTGRGIVENLNVEYTAEENETWSYLFGNSLQLFSKYAAPEYMEGLERLKYTQESVPMHKEVSHTLSGINDWKLTPVGGSISGLEFQSLLAAKHMPTTVYIRPKEHRGFTPEPDCYHELVGHAPLVAGPPELAQLHYEFGTALQGNASKKVRQAIFCVFFNTFEVGMIETPLGVRALGASVLSGANELQHAMTSPELHKEFDIRTILKEGSLNEDAFKPVYFVAKSVKHLVSDVRDFLADPEAYLPEGTVSGNPKA